MSFILSSKVRDPWVRVLMMSFPRKPRPRNDLTTSMRPVKIAGEHIGRCADASKTGMVTTFPLWPGVATRGGRLLMA